jgi:hypothetical protein
VWQAFSEILQHLQDHILLKIKKKIKI